MTRTQADRTVDLVLELIQARRQLAAVRALITGRALVRSDELELLALARHPAPTHQPREVTT